MPLSLFPTKHKHKQKLLQTPSKSKSNLKPQTRGNRRSETEEIRLKNEIFSLSDNHTDYEIMEILKMPNSTYYSYKQKLYQEAREIWRHTYKESQEYRIMHTINSINLALRINKEIGLDQKQSAKDRLEASEKMVETELAFLKLLRDINENKQPTPTPTPTPPRPTTYPTIVDPNDPDRFITDPAWIEENMKKL
jgi:RNA processing factor Prp31